jgi:hypothetical protein
MDDIFLLVHFYVRFVRTENHTRIYATGSIFQISMSHDTTILYHFFNRFDNTEIVK